MTREQAPEAYALQDEYVRWRLEQGLIAPLQPADGSNCYQIDGGLMRRRLALEDDCERRDRIAAHGSADRFCSVCGGDWSARFQWQPGDPEPCAHVGGSEYAGVLCLPLIGRRD